MKFRITHTLANNPPAVPENDSVTLSLEDHIEGFIDHLPAVMNFNFPEEIPGNIAGGVGTDQQDCPVGANPSRFDDVRTADGTLEVTRDESGTLHVEPDVTYTVEDTVDLCPGNCGGMMEWLATVLLSRFEATGISGDVPFEVSFPAPMDPFTVTPVGPSPDPAEGTDGGASPSDGTDGGASDGTGGGPSKTSTYEVQQGDTLWEIAKSEYGDPTKWEKIASENGIDDPRQLRVGTVLDIPPA